MRGSFLPFQITYYWNGHHYIERELRRQRVAFRKDDNAFLAVADPPALPAAADRFMRRLSFASGFDYWTWLVGPKFSKTDRQAINRKRPYSIQQVEYCRNLIFRRHSPIHKLFERSCDIGLLRMTPDKITQIFGFRINKNLRGKLQSVLEKREPGHTSFGPAAKNVVLRMYEKFTTFLRLEALSIHLKRLRHEKVAGSPGRRSQEADSAQIHEAILTTFGLAVKTYTLTQLRYDIRKLKAHGLVERDGKRYAFRLTPKGNRAALMFVLFHKRVCGPLANSLFNPPPRPEPNPATKLQAAYRKADQSIQQILQLLAA